MGRTWAIIERELRRFRRSPTLMIVSMVNGETSGKRANPEWLTAMWPAFEAECAGVGRGGNLAEAAFCLDAIRAAYAGREAARA